MGLASYSEQHNALLTAVAAFTEKIQQYKKTFVQREVLVHRGFLQYLLGTFSNELSQVGGGRGWKGGRDSRDSRNSRGSD